MEENNKGLIWLIVILIVLVFVLVGFIIYDKVVLDDKNSVNENPVTNEINDSNQNIDNNATNENTINKQDKLSLPSDLSDYSLLYWNYEEIYNYYFKMNKKDSKINIDSSFKDVKIENNKLYWNIDKQWVSDKIIDDDIKYFNMSISPLSDEYFIVVTETNKIYYITFDGVCFYCTDDDENNYYISLTKELYDKFKYNEIVVNEKINKISSKVFTECEGWEDFYFEINNKILVLNKFDLKLEDLNSFLSDRTITDLANTCSVGYELPLIIEHDGTIKGIYDKNNELIRVKHYVSLEKGEKDYYDIVIDKNNYLYIIDKNSQYQEVLGIVVNFKYEKDDFGNEKLEIDLKNNQNIYKETKRN